MASKKTCKIEVHFAVRHRHMPSPVDTWCETVCDRAPIWTAMETAVEMARKHKVQTKTKGRITRVVISLNLWTAKRPSPGSSATKRKARWKVDGHPTIPTHEQKPRTRARR